MNDKKNLAIGILSFVCIILGMLYVTKGADIGVGIGAPGTRAGIEEYVPYIKYNEGYYSIYGVTTLGDVTAAAGTFSGAVSASSLTAPTTNTATSSVKGGCFQSNATSTGSVGHIAYSTSAISTTTFEGTKTGYPAILVFGACN